MKSSERCQSRKILKSFRASFLVPDGKLVRNK